MTRSWIKENVINQDEVDYGTNIIKQKSEVIILKVIHSYNEE